MKRKRRKKLLTEKNLVNLTTVRLVSYLKALHTCHDNFHWDDEICSELVKSSDQWKNHYNLVKKILANRENLNDKS